MNKDIYPREERRGFDGTIDGNEFIYDATMQNLLLPGSDTQSVKCNIRDYAGNESDVDHVIEDPYNCNCLFPGEIAQVKFDPQSGVLMPNGSSGLIRKAVPTANIDVGESGTATLISEDDQGEEITVGEIELWAVDSVLAADVALNVQFRRDLGAKVKEDGKPVQAAAGRWVPINASETMNFIRGKCLSDVTVNDPEFNVEVFESHPGKVEGEQIVVNPTDSENSNKYGYVLKKGDHITARTWLDGKFLCIDGPCNANNEQASNAPTDIILSNDDVDEEEPGQIVGLLTAEDEDLPDDNHSFAIIGDDGGMEIDGSVLKVKDDAGLDSANSPQELTIQATDGGGNTLEKEFSITINSITSLGRFAMDNISASFAGGSPPNKDHSQYNDESIPNNTYWWLTNYTVAAADTITFEVRNTGAGTLTVSDISVFSANGFFGLLSKSSMSIASGGTDTVTVTLFSATTPSSGDSYFGTITFVHDGDEFGQPTPFRLTVRANAT